MYSTRVCLYNLTIHFKHCNLKVHTQSHIRTWQHVRTDVVREHNVRLCLQASVNISTCHLEENISYIFVWICVGNWWTKVSRGMLIGNIIAPWNHWSDWLVNYCKQNNDTCRLTLGPVHDFALFTSDMQITNLLNLHYRRNMVNIVCSRISIIIILYYRDIIYTR